MESRNRYIEKLKKSKKINDFLLMRKRRAKSHTILSWPSQTYYIGNVTLVVRVDTIDDHVILNVESKTKLSLKEYGLKILHPIEQEKIILRQEVAPFKFKTLTEDITSYIGAFKFYIIFANDKEFISNDVFSNPYLITNHNAFNELNYICGINQKAYLSFNSEALTEKNITKVKLVNVSDQSIIYTSNIIILTSQNPDYTLYFETPNVILCGKYNIYLYDSNYGKEIKIEGNNNYLFFYPLQPLFFFTYKGMDYNHPLYRSQQDIIRIIPDLAFPLSNQYRAYLTNQLNEKKNLLCYTTGNHITISKNLSSDDKTLYSNIWKLNFEYYNKTFQSKDFLNNYQSALNQSIHNTFSIYDSSYQRFYQTIYIDDFDYDYNTWKPCLVLIEPGSSSIISVLTNYLTPTNYNGTIPYYGKYLIKEMIFKVELDQVLFSDVEETDSTQFFEFFPTYAPEIKNIIKRQNTNYNYQIILKHDALYSDDKYKDEDLLLSLFHRSYSILNEFNQEIPFKIINYTNTIDTDDTAKHTVSVKIPSGIKDFFVLNKMIIREELEDLDGKSYYYKISNDSNYDYAITNVYPTGNVVINSNDPTLREVVTSDKSSEDSNNNISCLKCYLIDKDQGKSYEAEPILTNNKCFLTVEFKNLTQGNYHFYLVNYNYQVLKWNKTIDISLQQFEGENRNFAIDEAQNIRYYFQDILEAFNITRNYLTMASIEQIIKLDLNNIPTFTKEHLGGYKLYFEVFSDGNLVKIVYINYYFNLFNPSFQSDFLLNNYKIFSHDDDFRSHNKHRSYIYISDNINDFSFYETKELTINKITATNKNLFCKLEEIKNLSFKAELNNSNNKVSLLITLFNDYYLGHYEYNLYFSNGWVLTYDVYNFTCVHLPSSIQNGELEFFLFGAKPDLNIVELVGTVDGNDIHFQKINSKASTTEYPLLYLKYSVIEADKEYLQGNRISIAITYKRNETINGEIRLDEMEIAFS